MLKFYISTVIFTLLTIGHTIAQSFSLVSISPSIASAGDLMVIIQANGSSSPNGNSWQDTTNYIDAANGNNIMVSLFEGTQYSWDPILNQFIIDYVPPTATKLMFSDFNGIVFETVNLYLPLSTTNFSLKVSSSFNSNLVSIETDAKQYVNTNLQYSYDGLLFQTILSSTKNSVNYKHPIYSNGLHCYRLELEDNNGNKSYSQTSVCNNGINVISELTIFPNPTLQGQAINIAFTPIEFAQEYKIFNSYGTCIQTGTLHLNQTNISLFNSLFAQGQYYFSVSNQWKSFIIK